MTQTMGSKWFGCCFLEPGFSSTFWWTNFYTPLIQSQAWSCFCSDHHLIFCFCPLWSNKLKNTVRNALAHMCHFQQKFSQAKGGFKPPLTEQQQGVAGWQRLLRQAILIMRERHASFFVLRSMFVSSSSLILWLVFVQIYLMFFVGASFLLCLTPGEFSPISDSGAIIPPFHSITLGP